MSKAYDKISKGLKEALAVARGETPVMTVFRKDPTAQRKLNEIKKILKSQYQKTIGAETVTVDTDAYYALEGVLQDIKHTGQCDEVCIRTIQDVQMRISQIMKIAECE